MTRPEVDLAIDWAAAEGWNPGLRDADCFYAADPNGFLIGLLEDKPIATLSAVKYGDAFGFMGFYIVQPAYRHQGYGMPIWQAGLRYLQQRSIGLDGVVEQQANYERSGFRLAHQNIRYRGSGGGSLPSDSAIMPLMGVPFEQVLAYDLPFFPAGRPAFLQRWIAPPHQALGIWQNQALAGYGVLRACRTGHKIGPLFANSPALAERLFLGLKAVAPAGAAIFIDIPAVNWAAVKLMAQQQMTLEFETARMYSGQPLNLPLERIFGITTFELG